MLVRSVLPLGHLLAFDQQPLARLLGVTSRLVCTRFVRGAAVHAAETSGRELQIDPGVDSETISEDEDTRPRTRLSGVRVRARVVDFLESNTESWLGRTFLRSAGTVS